MDRIENITILIPAYNEAASIPLLIDTLEIIAKEMGHAFNFRYLFVNDGSKDNTIDVIREIRKSNKKVCYVNLSRNHGKELAMAAGFDFVPSESDAVIIMDADLQHPPKYIPEMIRLWKNGFDDVYGMRINRKGEKLFRKMSSLIFYKTLSYFSKEAGQNNIGDFRLLSKKAYLALSSIKDKQRYTKGLFALIGFNKIPFEFESDERILGSSTFNFKRLAELAIDGITSFSIKPLRFATFLGFLGAIISILYFLFILIKTFFHGEKVAGFPTLASLVLILGSLNLFCIGILGEYVGKIFIESKNRPLYYVESSEVN